MWHFEFEGHYELDETGRLTKSGSKKQWCQWNCFDVDEKMGLNQIVQQNVIKWLNLHKQFWNYLFKLNKITSKAEC